jgi:hypothetical protein
LQIGKTKPLHNGRAVTAILPEGNPKEFEELRAARRAFETTGVEFIDENGGGPGVRLRKH